MWILPKQLHTLACALDTEALTWDSEQLCQTYEQSLTVNGKPSRSRSFSAALKKVSWMQGLSTRTLKPSLGNSFVTEWVSSVGVTPASPSQPPETDSARTTLDTSGLGSRTESKPCSPSSASLRTLTGTSRWDSTQSSAIWKSLVTLRRLEFSARLKSALPISASAFSSWPTASTRDHKGGYSGGRIRKGKISMDTLDVAVQAYSEGGLLAPDKTNTAGSRLELWRTPSSSDGEGGIMEMRPGTAGKYKLRDHVHANWATPTARDFKSGKGNQERTFSELTPQVERSHSGKLNPRFVEALMGLPIGWVMPSCAAPSTIAHTNYGHSATASSHPSVPTPTELLLAS